MESIEWFFNLVRSFLLICDAELMPNSMTRIKTGT